MLKQEGQWSDDGHTHTARVVLIVAGHHQALCYSLMAPKTKMSATKDETPTWLTGHEEDASVLFFFFITIDR